MSVLIKGMEMPKSCFYCPFREKVNPDDYVCMALNKEFEETFSLIVGKRHKDCPLVPVPPHGDLVDINALKLAILDVDYVNKHDYLKGVLNAINNAPAVISADKDGGT